MKETRAEDTRKREGHGHGRALVNGAPNVITTERGVIRNVEEGKTMNGGGARRTTSKTRAARIVVCWPRGETPNRNLECTFGSPISKVTH